MITSDIINGNHIEHCIILKYIKNMIKNDFGTKKIWNVDDGTKRPYRVG